MAMVAGLLVTGSASAFRRAFGVDLANARPPVSLEVPTALRDSVASITIPAPRKITP